jgi:hypothetical protein
MPLSLQTLRTLGIAALCLVSVPAAAENPRKADC